jgi:hypothetical protein
VVNKCANNSCSALHAENEGSLFRLDIDIGNTAGETKRETTYLWLCASCSQQMSPKVTVVGDTIRVGLALTCHNAVRNGFSGPQVNRHLFQ